MKRTFVVLGIAFGVAVAALFAFLIYVLLASGDAKYWEGEIAAFERRDVSNPPPENAVLFVGGWNDEGRSHVREAVRGCFRRLQMAPDLWPPAHPYRSHSMR